MKTVRWKPVSVDTDGPDEHGEIDFTFVLQSPEGVPFFVAVSGPGKEQAQRFVEAAQTAAALLAHSTGGEMPLGSRAVAPEPADGVPLEKLHNGPETKQ